MSFFFEPWGAKNDGGFFWADDPTARMIGGEEKERIFTLVVPGAGMKTRERTRGVPDKMLGGI